jgi:hypothetical protein
MASHPKYLHGDLVLTQRNTASVLGEYAAHSSNATNFSNRDTVGYSSMHSFPKPSIEEAKWGERLKMKIENLNKHWMYNWILSIQDLESWNHEKQTEGAKPDHGLSSIFTYKGGKSHMLKKIREKAQELQTKMVGPC